MAIGLNAGAATVESAAMNLAAPPDFASAGASFSASAPGNGRGQPGSNRSAPAINITINASGSGEGQIREIKRATLEALSEAFQELGWELGIAPT